MLLNFIKKKSSNLILLILLCLLILILFFQFQLSVTLLLFLEIVDFLSEHLLFNFYFACSTALFPWSARASLVNWLFSCPSSVSPFYSILFQWNFLLLFSFFDSLGLTSSISSTFKPIVILNLLSSFFKISPTVLNFLNLIVSPALLGLFTTKFRSSGSPDSRTLSAGIAGLKFSTKLKTTKRFYYFFGT